jgi:hypothetical protein
VAPGADGGGIGCGVVRERRPAATADAVRDARRAAGDGAEGADAGQAVSGVRGVRSEQGQGAVPGRLLSRLLQQPHRLAPLLPGSSSRRRPSHRCSVRMRFFASFRFRDVSRAHRLLPERKGVVVLLLVASTNVVSTTNPVRVFRPRATPRQILTIRSPASLRSPNFRQNQDTSTFRNPKQLTG